MDTTMTAGGTTGTNEGTGSAGKLFAAAFTGGAIAAVVNLGIRIAGEAAGVTFLGEFRPGEAATVLPYGPVIGASLVPAVAAALFALLLKKVAGAKAATVFAVASVVLGLASMGGPASVKGLETGGVVALALMHVVATAAIGGFTWRRLAGR